MRWFKYSAISISILLLLAVILPFLIPLNRFIPQLEKLTSEKLGAPVKIAALKLSLLPLPAVMAEGIRVEQGQPIKIEALILRPALGSLFQDVKVLRSVELKGLLVNQRLIGLLAALASTANSGAQPVRVERIKLRALQLDLDTLQWGPLRADIELNETGVQAIEAGSEDGKFTLELTPRAGGQDLRIMAKNWVLPIKPALKFDDLTATGFLKQTTLNISEIRGKLYGGTLQGKANVDWARGWKINGEVVSRHVETKDIVALLTPTVGVSGKLHAHGGFSLRAKEIGQLANSLNGNFKFEVKQGVLYGFDLAQAIRTFAQGGTRGGQTRFDALTGTLVITGKQYRLKQIYVASGVLSANGNVDIAPSKKLSGLVNVAPKGMASLVEVPLDVSGTLSNPILLPNRAALAGAAAGTAILGPGFGTGAGSKAGQMLEKLFK